MQLIKTGATLVGYTMFWHMLYYCPPVNKYLSTTITRIHKIFLK